MGEHLTTAKFNTAINTFLYSRTEVPHVPLPDGWGQIFGAKGCYPQAREFLFYLDGFTIECAPVFGL